MARELHYTASMNGKRRILALLMPTLWAALPTILPAQVTVQKGAMEVTIAGPGWKLRYGTCAGVVHELFPLREGEACFSNGGWLRRIDTRQGVVTGRWRFPGEIRSVAVEGRRWRVESQIAGRGPDRQQVFHFDPHRPQIPYWPSDNLMPERVPACEVQPYAAAPTPGVDRSAQDMADRLRHALPDLEAMVRRDPHTPRFQAVLARMLRERGDARASELFDQAARTGADYTDLLPLASYLEEAGAAQASDIAWERGWRDYLERGHDPRLPHSLIERSIHMPLPRRREARGGPLDIRRAEDRKWIERIYYFAPSGEGAALAWQAHAQALAAAGLAAEAEIWRARAAESRKWAGAFRFFDHWIAWLDVTPFLLGGAVVAWLFLVLVLVRRGRRRRGSLRGADPMIWGPLVYATRSERIALFLIALAGWWTAGTAAPMVRGIVRISSAPISMMWGHLGGPLPARHLEQLPASAERDLLRALAHQQSGESARAERLYRRLPHFAESWNNLGALLQQQGRTQEAEPAYQQALAVDPDLFEANVNLGQEITNDWAVLHRKYLPGRPMLAMPRAERWDRAFLGMPWWKTFLSGWGGPLALVASGSSDTGGSLAAAVSVLVAGFTVALLFFAPYREAATEPGRTRVQIAADVLAPGVSPAWSWAAGVVLLACCALWLQELAILRAGTNRIFTAIVLPSLRSYGVADDNLVRALLRPHWFWLWGGLALLYVINALVVWRAGAKSELPPG
jgi:tetratricopeptide (TPR) repeat protein